MSGLPEGAGGTAAEAARQYTARVQHRLNNPLAALLAEAQLLALEPSLDPEYRAAVERMVALVRRLVAIVRSLDEDASSA